MIINRDHIPWMFIVLVGSVLAAIYYLAALHPALLPFPLPLPGFLEPTAEAMSSPGGTPLGLLYGGFSLLVFIFATLLGLRKKLRLWRIGHVQLWYRAHIWLTILTIPLVLFHCDFKAGGPMTTFLLILYAFVMLSGFFGLFLQHIIPKLMKNLLPCETVYDQIPHLRKQLIAKAQNLLEMLGSGKTANHATAVPYFQTFLKCEVLPFFKKSNFRSHKLARQSTADDLFRLLKLRLPKDMQEMADQAEDWCNEHRRLDLQSRLHRWMHGWILLHAPVSFLLLLLTIWHAIITVFYY